jgi:hypothetical protein
MDGFTDASLNVITISSIEKQKQTTASTSLFRPENIDRRSALDSRALVFAHGSHELCAYAGQTFMRYKPLYSCLFCCVHVVVLLSCCVVVLCVVVISTLNSLMFSHRSSTKPKAPKQEIKSPPKAPNCQTKVRTNVCHSERTYATLTTPLASSESTTVGDIDELEQECSGEDEGMIYDTDDRERIKEFHLWQESKALLGIALPAVAVQFSVLFIFPQTASVVGRQLGKEALAGFSLGSLVGNLTCSSVMVGALTAADTLMPRAFASGRYDELGRLAIRGFILCCVFLIPPVVPLCTMMEGIFDKLGQDEAAAAFAAEWIKVFLVGVPAMLLFRVIQSFLNAQVSRLFQFDLSFML